MENTDVLSREVAMGAIDYQIEYLYCCSDEDAVRAHRERILNILHKFGDIFSENNNSAMLFSSPGRTELGGNHTDHQNGKVLAASVDLDMLACAAPNGSSIIRINSEGYPELTVDISDLTPRTGERETSSALVRGIASAIADMGFEISGFDACITSMIPAGSGLSSSAAYEVLIGSILNKLYCDGSISPVKIARIGRFAENVFFGKPCGLMDQMACAVGGIIAIDFSEPENPVYGKIQYSFAGSGYTLCIIDSGADHADLTDAYADITEEMGAVANAFGQKVLRDVKEEEFHRAIPELRGKYGERAILRSQHFFSDTRRAGEQSKALEEGDLVKYFSLVRNSGKSSGLYLQNLYLDTSPQEQPITLAICIAEELLEGAGAVRVHGGGFAGTIQAYVPNTLRDEFKKNMEMLVGADKCHFVNIRPIGGCALLDIDETLMD